MDGNLYQLKFNRKDDSKEAYPCEISTSKPIQVWHRRLGHISMSGLEKIAKSGMLKDVKSVDFKNATTEVCKHCAEGKMSKLPWKYKTSSTERPLELIWSDIFGPVSPESKDGKRYFISFLDDYTHFTVIYLIKNKSEAYDKFVEYVKMATSKFNMNISRLKCDNAQEYKSEKFRNFCLKNGIQVQYTVPYTPQLNSKAERFNRHIVERARCMMHDSKMAKDLWHEALLAAAYVINRSCTVNNKIPANLWYNKDVDLSNLKVFGCRAFAHIPKEKRSKFDPKAIECYFVGYAPNGYRLWWDGEIIICRDVIFDETKNYSDLVEDSVKIDDPKLDDNELQKGEEIEFFEEKDITKKIVKPTRQTVKPKWLDDFELNLCVQEDISFEDIHHLSRQEQEKWNKAMGSELDSMKSNDVWELVGLPSPETEVIDTKWVLKIKSNGQYKARLVARGFQQKNTNYEELYAPVAKLPTVKTMLAVAAAKKMHISQMDVNTAFLNSPIHEEVYVRQPPGYQDNTNRVCKLKRSLYGLKASPRNWNDYFDSFMQEINFVRSNADFDNV